MKIRKKQIRALAVALVVVLTLLFACAPLALAHSGRTDSSGGHHDNKNKSGLGSYHYHCGGHPAHLHPDGVCPYDSSSGSSSGSSGSSSKATQKPKPEATPKPTQDPYTATKVRIADPEDSTMDIYQTQQLKASVSPDTARDGALTWSCGDSGITVSATGKVTAVTPGSYTVTVTTAGGLKDTVKLKVSEKRYTNPEADFTFAQTDGGAQITACSAQDEFVSLPYEVNGMAVCAITDGAFNGIAAKKLRVPETVVSISAGAFTGCAAQLVVIPGSAAEQFAMDNGLSCESELPPVLPLEKGSRGPEVKLVQSALAQLGMLSDKIDGVFGKNTANAVKLYQQSRGIEENGKVDAATYEALLRGE